MRARAGAVARGRSRLRALVALVVLAAAPASAYELPSSRLTPGAVVSLDASAVCTRGYAHAARHRYDTQWRRYRAAAFREYGIPGAVRRRFTLDHLVPIELGGRAYGTAGGTLDLRNVWPEPKAEAVRKDAVENALRAAVCTREGYRGLNLSLPAAQAAIAHDWTRTPVGLPVP